MMINSARYSALALALLAASAAAAIGADVSRRIYRSDDLNLIVETQALKLPRIDALIRTLDLKPGMTILDIGAGSGQQSYKIAEALKGTGKVYAADIDQGSSTTSRLRRRSEA